MDRKKSMLVCILHKNAHAVLQIEELQTQEASRIMEKYYSIQTF